jgi:hypothetical protein
MTLPTTRIIIGLSIFVCVFSAICAPFSAHAATGGQALEIGPPILNLSANPGQTLKASVSLRDISGGSLIVTNQINDFVAGGEDGTPKIILDSTGPNPYSIRDWITPVPQILLKTREIKIVPITINVPKNASPGGYYGVVRFTGTPPDLKGSGVSLSASLGALILLKVNGVAKESLTIEQFFANDGGNPGSLFEAAPIKFVTRLTNSGNIHEEPSGVVTISDMFNNTVATLPVNQPPHDILPGSIRRFEDTTLDSSNIGNKILFGLYHAKLDVTYGADKKTASTEIRFWVIPYKAILAIVIGLVALFFGFRFFIRRYNRLIIERAKNSK